MKIIKNNQYMCQRYGIDSLQCLNSSLTSLVKNLSKDVKYLSQVLDNDLLDLVKEKVVYPYEYIVVFQSLKKSCQAKKSFIAC